MCFWRICHQLRSQRICQSIQDIQGQDMQSFYIAFIQTPYHCDTASFEEGTILLLSKRWIRPVTRFTSQTTQCFEVQIQSFPGSPPCLLNITTCSLNCSIEPGVEKSHEHREMNSLWLGSSWLTFTDLLLGQLTPPLTLACLRASPCVTTLGRAGPYRIQMISSSSFRFLTELHEAMLG